MVYELYLDSLFLVNFVMNLYLLELVNLRTLRTAPRRRVAAGAALGALAYMAPFFFPGPGWLKLSLGFLAGTAGMIKFTFRARSFRAFFRVGEKLLWYSFLMGGGLLFVIGTVPALREKLLTVFGILGAGAVLFLALSWQNERKNGRRFCRAVLVGKGARITVNALIDTGNSLTEPISGKPVSIIDRHVFEGLWREGEPEGYRAVPYHSIGKKRGILQGYLLPELLLEIDGMTKICRNVYVGVSEELLSAEENLEEERFQTAHGCSTAGRPAVCGSKSLKEGHFQTSHECSTADSPPVCRGESYKMILNPRLLEADESAAV